MSLSSALPGAVTGSGDVRGTVAEWQRLSAFQPSSCQAPKLIQDGKRGGSGESAKWSGLSNAKPSRFRSRPLQVLPGPGRRTCGQDGQRGTDSTAGPGSRGSPDGGGSAGEESLRVLGTFPEPGCHEQLTTVLVAEPGSSLDAPDPSSAGASASGRHPLHLVHNVQGVCF